jgi:hypothetical protein
MQGVVINRYDCAAPHYMRSDTARRGLRTALHGLCGAGVTQLVELLLRSGVPWRASDICSWGVNLGEHKSDCHTVPVR